MTTKCERVGKSQKLHMKVMRAIEDMVYPNGEWRGRRSKKEDVIEWHKAHPNGTVMQCHKDTGMSRVTIYKYWNE